MTYTIIVIIKFDINNFPFFGIVKNNTIDNSVVSNLLYHSKRVCFPLLLNHVQEESFHTSVVYFDILFHS